tara:strand:- start:1970 stop:2935 length:966 start_codon:yes stop_codon:yes gene_type:complete
MNSSIVLDAYAMAGQNAEIFSNFILGLYGLFGLFIITMVVGSNFQGFRALVNGFVTSIQLGLNIFTRNTVKVAGEEFPNTVNMEEDGLLERHARHESLAGELKLAGDQFNESVEWVVAIPGRIKNWALNALVSSVAFVVECVLALEEMVSQVAIWVGTKIEDASIWWNGLFVKEVNDSDEDEIIDAVYEEPVSKYNWLQRMLGLDVITELLIEIKDENKEIKDLLAKNETPEIPSVVVDEDYMTTVKEVTRGGAAQVLSIGYIENAKWEDLRALAVVYGVLKGRKMPKHTEMMMLVGRAVDEHNHWGRSPVEVAAEMQLAA